MGPTAAGKTTTAVALARRSSDLGVHVELVSADSMAVYRGMDIGTATPTAAELDGVSLHLVDVVDPHEEWSVARFQRDASRVIDDLSAAGTEVVVVGGTGLYVHALVDGFEIPPQAPQVRARLEAEADALEAAAGGETPLAPMHRRLTDADADAASRIEPTNRRRLLRALEVIEATGRRFSSFGPGFTYPPSDHTLVGIDRPAGHLDDLIERRVQAMVGAGLVAEVAALLERVPPPGRTARQALGYKELFEHLDGAISLDEAIERIVVRTRRFARRQRAWFRRDPRIRWFEPSGEDSGAMESLASEVLEHWSHT